MRSAMSHGSRSPVLPGMARPKPLPFPGMLSILDLLEFGHNKANRKVSQGSADSGFAIFHSQMPNQPYNSSAPRSTRPQFSSRKYHLLSRGYLPDFPGLAVSQLFGRAAFLAPPDQKDSSGKPLQ